MPKRTLRVADIVRRASFVYLVLLLSVCLVSVCVLVPTQVRAQAKSLHPLKQDESCLACHGAAAGAGLLTSVVDDDRALRDVLRRALTLTGYEISLAESGGGALSLTTGTGTSGNYSIASGKSISIDPAKHAASVHGTLGCNDCHATIKDFPHPNKLAKVQFPFRFLLS